MSERSQGTLCSLHHCSQHLAFVQFGSKLGLRPREVEEFLEVQKLAVTGSLKLKVETEEQAGSPCAVGLVVHCTREPRQVD